MNFQQALEGALSSAIELSESSAIALRDYAANRTAHLLTVAGEPGYDEAVKIEVANVTAYAAELAVNGADAIDAEVRGLIAGALRIGVAALA